MRAVRYGILAVGLLAAAPARVAEDVDVGRPVGQAEVLPRLSLRSGLVVLGARLVGDGPRRPGRSAARRTTPPCRSPAGTPWPGRRGPRRAGTRSTSCRPARRAAGSAAPVHHLRDLLPQRHPPHEDLRPLFRRQFHITVTTVDIGMLHGFMLDFPVMGNGGGAFLFTPVQARIVTTSGSLYGVPSRRNRSCFRPPARGP